MAEQEQSVAAWMYTYPGAQPIFHLKRMDMGSWVETPLYPTPDAVNADKAVAEDAAKLVAELRAAVTYQYMPMSVRQHMSSAATMIEKLAATNAGQVETCLAALNAARSFIINGVELGFIRMPDPETPDTAHNTLPLIEVALAALKANGDAS